MRRRDECRFSREPGAPPPIVAAVRHRVQFREVDLMEVVWHGNYPALFELAHTELARRCGFCYDSLKAAGLIAPIVKLRADYLRPLRLYDEVAIQAALVWLDSPRVNVEYSVFDGSGALCCEGLSVQLFVDAATGETLWHVPDMWAAFLTRWRNGEFDHAE